MPGPALPPQSATRAPPGLRSTRLGPGVDSSPGRGRPGPTLSGWRVGTSPREAARGHVVLAHTRALLAGVELRTPCSGHPRARRGSGRRRGLPPGRAPYQTRDAPGRAHETSAASAVHANRGTDVASRGDGFHVKRVRLHAAARRSAGRISTGPLRARRARAALLRLDSPVVRVPRRHHSVAHTHRAPGTGSSLTAARADDHGATPSGPATAHGRDTARAGRRPAVSWHERPPRAPFRGRAPGTWIAAHAGGGWACTTTDPLDHPHRPDADRPRGEACTAHGGTATPTVPRRRSAGHPYRVAWQQRQHDSTAAGATTVAAPSRPKRFRHNSGFVRTP